MRVNNIESAYVTHTVSAVRKLPLSTKITTESGQAVCAIINVRRCLTTAPSGLPVTGRELPTSSGQHFRTVGITRSRDMPNGTTVPISTIFYHFRDMPIGRLQSQPATHIVSDVFKRPLSTKISTSSGQAIYASRNVRRCLTNDPSGFCTLSQRRLFEYLSRKRTLFGIELTESSHSPSFDYSRSSSWDLNTSTLITTVGLAILIQQGKYWRLFQPISVLLAMQDS